jgi:predicted lipoprotein with Yx(FWY)xxD motif
VCQGDCLVTWPPLARTGTPTAGTGVDAAKIGTITRSDGSSQVTYAGWPLYHFAADAAPGDVMGQGVGGVWFAVLPDGTAAA